MPIFENGEVLYMDGTNCSVSILAGIVSLCNDFATTRYGHRLGFLYSPRYYFGLGIWIHGFKDIRIGLNPGCGTNGFAAGIGWDPVTGLGTLDFEGMLKMWRDRVY